jgi:hypothetical protein
MIKSSTYFCLSAKRFKPSDSSKTKYVNDFIRLPGESTHVCLGFRIIFEFPDLCRTEKSDPNGLKKK